MNQPKISAAPRAKNACKPKTTAPERESNADCQPDTLTEQIIRSLKETVRLTELLAAERDRQKMSNSRITGIGRELKELIKVASRYLNT